MELNSDHLQMCRTCLFDPVDSYSKPLKMIPIFTTDDVADVLNEKICQVYDIKIEKNDIRPKLICEKCYAFVMQVYDRRRVAAESQIIINFISMKRNRHNQGKRKNNLSDTEIDNEEAKKATPDKANKETRDKASDETKWAVPEGVKKSTSEKVKPKRVTKKLDSEIQRRFKSITNYIESQCSKE